MIKTLHDIFDGLILITYITENHTHRKSAIPLISRKVTGIIMKKYADRIKG